MVERVLVLCEDCGHPYTTRRVDGELIPPTSGGHCECGNDRFAEAEYAVDDEQGTTG
jgi:hypothetical protein